MIRNLIFDFGKVLVDYTFDSLKTYISDPEESARFYQLVTDPQLVDRWDKELTPYNDIVAELKQKYPQWAEQLQHFSDHQIDIILGEMPGMHDLLIRLKKEGFHLYGLSNWSSKVYEVMDKYDIFQLLEGRIISSEAHILKPDIAIYQTLLDTYHLRAEECVFTDDKLINVEGARAAGLHAILFQNAEQYTRDLRNIITSECNS